MDYMDIEEAALRLGKSTKTLRRWIAARKINYRMQGAKYLFSVDDLEAKRTETSSDRVDNAALLERIEGIENALQSFSERLNKLEAYIPVTAAPAAHTRPSTLRPTRLIYDTDKGALPGDLVSFRQFADLHNIAQSTVQRAIERGRLPVQRGRWKQGRAWVEMALDGAGQRLFYELFSETYPGFKACPRCPHNV